MRFRYLGPLEVFDGHAWRPIAAAKQRALLTSLLLSAGSVVSRDELIDKLWGNSPPGGAANQIHGYVMRLRRLMADPEGKVLVTSPPGYLLATDPGEIDARRFERQAQSGRVAFENGELRQARETLIEALGLWRGPAFADVPVDFVRTEADRLEELRLSTTLIRIDADLSLGRHDELIPELSALAEKCPLQEKVWEQMLLALYRVGRQADALAGYRRVYRLLDEELGVQPGRRLQRLHEQILDCDPELDLPDPAPVPASATRATVPRQLPAHPFGFVGRVEEVRRLTKMLDEAAEAGGAVVISAIGGAGGVGKTALALYWSHQVAERFPDGQLYVNLRGFAEAEPMTPATAMRVFLDALGVDAARIPADLDAQSALLRSLTAGKRMLVVLDNARDVDQIEPLLPGADGPLVLVTSRRELPGLIVRHGARPLTLDVLTMDEAIDLLTARLGADRTHAEPDAVARVVEQCARLPLALSVVAARAALDAGLDMATVAAELGDERTRLVALEAGDAAASVRAAFSWSYRQLDADTARMFRLLGVHPGPDISVPAAASLAGVPSEEAHARLVELTRVQLLTEHVAGRFTFHDLLRSYAAERAEAEDSEDDRHAAIRRSLDHYLHTAHAAALLQNPYREPITLPALDPRAIPEELGDYERAMVWLDLEYPVLLAAINLAASHGLHAHAWQLPWTIANYFDQRGHWQDGITVNQIAVAAARRAGNERGQAQADRYLARAYARRDLYEQAHACLRDALDVGRHVGDQVSLAQTHLELGMLAELQHQFEDALEQAQQALGLYRAAGHRVGEAAALNNVGWCNALLGHYRETLSYCQQALEVQRELHDRDGQAGSWNSLGYAYHNLGRYRDAMASYQESINLCRQLGDRYNEADTLAQVGDTQHALGDHDAAREAWQQALDILEELKHADAEAVRAKLQSLTS